MKTILQLGIIALFGIFIYSNCNNDSNSTAENDANVTYTAADTTLSTVVVTADTVSAHSMIQNWNETSRLTADRIMQHYGAPNEITPTMLIWQFNDPWQQTIVHKAVVFAPNSQIAKDAVLEQTVYYEVPADKADDLLQFNKSLIVDLGNNTLSARSNSEATNYLLLNLANDIITGKKTAAQAQQYYNDNLTADNDYTKGFTFNYHRPENADRIQ